MIRYNDIIINAIYYVADPSGLRVTANSCIMKLQRDTRNL